MSKPIQIPLASILISKKGSKPSIFKSKTFDNSLPYLDIHALETGEIRQFTYRQLGSRTSDKDVLVVWDGSRSGLPFKGRDGIIGSTLVALTPICLDTEYLYYFLKYKFEFINGNTVGSGVPHVNSELFFNLQIPYIPIELQKTVIEDFEAKVKKNKSLFSSQQQAILNTLSQKSHVSNGTGNDLIAAIDDFRSTMLNMAFEGELTQSWREKNKKVSVSNVLKDKIGLIPDVLPENWISTEIDNVSSLVTDGKHGNCKDEVNSGYYFLSAKDVKDGKLSYERARQITFNDFNETHRRTNLQPGDLCIVSTGATIGKTAIAQDDEKTTKTTFQKSVAIIKVIPDYLDVRFLNYFIIANNHKLHNQSSGTAIKNLLIGDIKSLVIPIPPLEEQLEIIDQIDSCFKLANNVEEKYKNALIDLAGFEKSLLQNIFDNEIHKIGFESILEEELLTRITLEKKEVEKNIKTELIMNNKEKKLIIENIEIKQSVLEILEQQSSVTTEELWQQSTYFETKDVEGFYNELSALKKDNKLGTRFIDDSNTFTTITLK